VNASRFPLRINVGFLFNLPAGASRDIHFDTAPFLHLEPDLDLVDFKGMVHISRTPQGLLFQGDFVGKARMECVRCLAEYDQLLHTRFDELYSFTLKTVTDENLIVPEDGNIDLASVVGEYLVLEMPICPLCRPDCKGLCSECGAEWNLETCEHERKRG
jgi:uncharacterized protein